MSDERKSFVLINDRVRGNAIQAVRDAGERCRVTIVAAQRTNDQNAKLHALLSDLASSALEWAGKRRTLDEWKMLMVSAHAVATKQAGEVIPGIEGEFVAIRESTALMTVARCASLIEYILAFCATHDVELHETEAGGFMEAA